MDIDELIKIAEKHYTQALKLIEADDIYDAAEKTWLAIETIRKAFLVALGVPYEKTKSVAYSLPLFNRLLKALGLKDILRMYESFYYRLHAMGFYKNLTPTEEIVHTIKVEVLPWIEKMKRIITSIHGTDISEILKRYDEAIKLKREIMAKNIQLVKIYQNINNLLAKKLEPIKNTLPENTPK
ncbi:MAG: PaREP1 family protein [Candidatus Njordarchaeota archaeon]